MSKDVGQQAAEAKTLRRVFPYLRLFRGKTFVVKAGGAALVDDAACRAFLEQVATIEQLGVRVVVVHGGGPQATDLAGELGIPVRMVDGRRVTDERMLAAAVMTLNGTINTRLTAAGRAVGARTVGLSGVDAGLVRVRRRPPVVTADGSEVDYGQVGDIAGVDPSVLLHLLDGGFIPIVSPISADDRGTLLNVNADSVAAALAVALKAEKLVLVTEAAGVLERVEDPRSLISYIDLPGLARMREAGQIAGGMLPKVAAIESALASGVPRAHIVSSRVADSLLVEVFTNEGSGTLIVPDLTALAPTEQ
ncbi:MAG TPA: acetylglutamate kinase [Thermoanaerobaculia bacterium]|nr:acetylglutamate kinase [Thermoanaerobaculia bacterium]